MLNIGVPSSTKMRLTFQAFEGYGLPAPPNGVDAEINGDVILKFEDEEDAIIYAAQLENMANEINDKTTTQYLAINDIIAAVRNDEFVLSYSR